MIKKTITAKDYNGVERTEEFYFHLDEDEIMDMQLGTKGGLDQMLKQIIMAQDETELASIYKKIILKSYGVKTPDGRGFRKSQEFIDDFVSTKFYSKLFMELGTSDEKLAEFIRGIIPDDMKGTFDEAVKSGTLPDGTTVSNILPENVTAIAGA